jgi:cbb3-type cytochrome oxidase subunit 3
MTEDHELDVWREQWSSAVRPSPELRRQVQQRIAAQDRRFLWGNVLTAMAFLGMLIFALFLRRQASRIENEQAVGLFVLLLVSLACRWWLLRGTWRAETQSTRAYLELWQRRARAQVRRLQIAMYIAAGWLVFCAALAAANWTAIRLEVMAHPLDYLILTMVLVLMQPVLWGGAVWLRRRKMAELEQVQRLLEEISR